MKNCLMMLLALVLITSVPVVYGKSLFFPIDQRIPFQSNNFIIPLDEDTLNFDLCQVITGPEISGLAPFTGTFKQVIPEDGDLENFTSCNYEWEVDRKLGYPQAGITINQFETAKESQDHFKTRVQDWKNSWQRDPQFYSNLCDSAVFYDGNEDKMCGVCAIAGSCGRYYILIQFAESSMEIPGRKYKDSEESVLNLLLQKKPFLKGKK